MYNIFSMYRWSSRKWNNTNNIQMYKSQMFSMWMLSRLHFGWHIVRMMLLFSMYLFISYLCMRRHFFSFLFFSINFLLYMVRYAPSVICSTHPGILCFVFFFIFFFSFHVTVFLRGGLITTMLASKWQKELLKVFRCFIIGQLSIRMSNV